ncbi:MAG: HEAT repeat domain-containing protein [Gammaproteobacteria bacterium]
MQASTEKLSSQDSIYARLRSDRAEDRVAALQRLNKQPRLARQAMSPLLALLADDRQVERTRYVGAGFHDVGTVSPAMMAAELLARLGRWSVIPLRLRLQDSNPVVRRYAVRALGLMVNPEHAGWLLQSLTDSDVAVSMEAYTALQKQDPQVYVKLIKQRDLNDMLVQQSQLHIQLLGQSRHGDALPVLFRLASASNPVLRRASFAALANFAEASLESIVLQGLRDSDLQVRESALLLTPQHRSPEVLAAVLAQLSVDDVNVQQTAYRLLPELTGASQRPMEDWQEWRKGQLHIPSPSTPN